MKINKAIENISTTKAVRWEELKKKSKITLLWCTINFPLVSISGQNQSRTCTVLVPEAVKISQSFTRLSFPPVASMKCGALPLVSWKAGSVKKKLSKSTRTCVMYHSLHWLNDKCYSDLWLRITSQQAPSTIQTLNEKWYINWMLWW